MIYWVTQRRRKRGLTNFMSLGKILRISLWGGDKQLSLGLSAEGRKRKGVSVVPLLLQSFAVYRKRGINKYGEYKILMTGTI